MELDHPGHPGRCTHPPARGVERAHSVPETLADVAAALVCVLAETQGQLAKIRSSRLYDPKPRLSCDSWPPNPSPSPFASAFTLIGRAPRNARG